MPAKAKKSDSSQTAAEENGQSSAKSADRASSAVEAKPEARKTKAGKGEGGSAAGGSSATTPPDTETGLIRFAVVGLGHIAQNAVLPAFEHAKEHAKLGALVSDDPAKLKTLGKRYGVDKLFAYKDYLRCLRSGDIDAVYIATPNSLHMDFALAAARAGVHVLCEKPLAVTTRECRAIIESCRRNQVKLMTAYRLHFEPANLKAVEVARSGDIGEPMIFNSVFTMQVTDPDNIRLDAEMGGGPLHDIGIYCINAARSLFQAEPVEAIAWESGMRDKRFCEVPQTVSAMLRFDQGRVATFTCSFGAADVSAYDLVGAKGHIRLDPAYEYSGALKYRLTVDGTSTDHEVPASDQFAAELVYFADCLNKDIDPEPSGAEGEADVRVIRALQWSLRTGRAAYLDPALQRVRHPSPKQTIRRPPQSGKAKLVHATPPHEE